MADVNITNALLGLVTIAVGWLFKTTIQHAKDLVAIQTAFKMYVEGVGKGAAMVLDKPNPTPPEISRIYKKWYAHEEPLTAAEKTELKEYLQRYIEDPSTKASDRSAAMQLLVGMEAINLITRHARHH